MKIHWKSLVICISIPLLVGEIAAFLTRNQMDLYSTIIQPTFSPPGWLFPIVWTVLYILMGISLYLIYQSDHSIVSDATTTFAIQLLANFLWSIVFFNLRTFIIALLILLLLVYLIIKMIIQFRRISSVAGNLQIPYLLWCCFAVYLNFAIVLLN